LYVDTHTHLDLDHFPDVESVIESAQAAGVGRIINIGFGPDRWESTIDLARRFQAVSFTLGFHPGDSGRFNHESKAKLIDLIERTEPVGIGEAGIDLHWPDNPPLSQQRDVFAFQIELAIEHGLPLVIHQRAADAEVYEQLRAADPALRVVLHSFDGSEKTLRLAMDRGWFIGVGGLMTRRAAPVRRPLETVPLDRVILETDSPYLVPAGLQDRRNTPANIPVICERFAGLRGLTVDAVREATTQNAIKAFPRLNVMATVPGRMS